jgi:hypothetical protein
MQLSCHVTTFVRPTRHRIPRVSRMIQRISDTHALNCSIRYRTLGLNL